MKGQRFERGQALVLIVLSVVAIFGFAALAVDMGRIYAERRRAQSASDASALAAAYAVANFESDDDAAILDLATKTALATALENGYNNLDQVAVNNPPDDYQSSHYEECKCEYIQVKIKSEVDPIFMQFIGRGTSEITTVSVARARLSQPISMGNAIHALLTENESGNAIVVDGDFNLDVKHGSIRSNKDGLKNSGSGKLNLEDGFVLIHNDWANKDGVWASNGIHEDVSPLIVPVPPAPDCNMDAGTASGNVYQPGKYSGITMGAGNWKMAPGMYCVNGNFTIGSGANVKGDGIFIVMNGGTLTIDANATVTWKRPNDLLDKSNNQWGGMLIYVIPPDTGTSKDIDLTGTSGSTFQGTVFSPRGLCGYGGNSQFTATTSFQLVCRQVNLHGNPNIGINYVENENYRMPPIVELVK